MTKELVEVCKGCYATTGFYIMPNVRFSRLKNDIAWRLENFVEVMVDLLKKERLFRWFDSGDCYNYKLALKIFEIMKLTPNVKHWLPTRMHKFDKFRKLFEEMNKLPNVVVRYSADSIGEEIEGEYISSVSPYEIEGFYTCPASERDGKCLDCEYCWNYAKIRYRPHGQKMSKVLKTIAL